MKLSLVIHKNDEAMEQVGWCQDFLVFLYEAVFRFELVLLPTQLFNSQKRDHWPEWNTH